jgi:hypothetical protein
MSAAKLGNTNRLGTTHTAETIDRIKLNQPNRKNVFVYLHETPEKLVGEYTSLFEASKSLEIPYTTLRRYLANGKVWNNKYIIRSSRLY